MEQARYWMWMRKKLLMSENAPYVVQDYSTNNNWEEQAFAEDSAGPLGGFIWPPRSYSCSFCGREFRSAQALGGHMNVHRRDRARLKQESPPSSTPTARQENENIQHHHHHHHKVPYTTTTTDDDQVCTVVYNSCASDRRRPVAAARVLNSTTVSPSKLKMNNYSRAHDQIGLIETKEEDEENIIVKPADSALSLYSPSTGRLSDNIGNEDDQVYMIMSNSNKRRWRDVSSTFNKQGGSSAVLVLDHDQCQHDFHKVNNGGLINIPSSMEELDLELRLGDRPSSS